MLTGTPQGTILLDSGNAADASLIGSASSSTSGSTNYDLGNFSMPSNGLMVVLVTARDGAAANLTGISIGGSAGTYYNLTTGGSNPKHGLGCRQVSSGNNNVTLNFSGNTSSNFFHGVSVWYVSGHISDIPRDTNATYTAAQTSISIASTAWGNSVTIYNWAGYTGGTLPSSMSWTGDSVTTDVAFATTGSANAKWGAAHNRNTNAALAAASVGVSWTTSADAFIAFATFK